MGRRELASSGGVAPRKQISVRLCLHRPPTHTTHHTPHYTTLTLSLSLPPNPSSTDLRLGTSPNNHRLHAHPAPFHYLSYQLSALVSPLIFALPSLSYSYPSKQPPHQSKREQRFVSNKKKKEARGFKKTPGPATMTTPAVPSHPLTLDPKYDDYDFPTTAPDAQSGHPGHTTPEQDAQVYQLRIMLEQLGYTERLDTLTLLRFLRARKFDVEAAKAMYVYLSICFILYSVLFPHCLGDAGVEQ